MGEYPCLLKTVPVSYVPTDVFFKIVGIAGSSGSGKTSLAMKIVSKLNLPWVVILSMVLLVFRWSKVGWALNWFMLKSFYRILSISLSHLNNPLKHFAMNTILMHQNRLTLIFWLNGSRTWRQGKFRDERTIHPSHIKDFKSLNWLTGLGEKQKFQLILLRNINDNKRQRQFTHVMFWFWRAYLPCMILVFLNC